MLDVILLIVFAVVPAIVLHDDHLSLSKLRDSVDQRTPQNLFQRGTTILIQDGSIVFEHKHAAH